MNQCQQIILKCSKVEQWSETLEELQLGAHKNQNFNTNHAPPGGRLWHKPVKNPNGNHQSFHGIVRLPYFLLLTGILSPIFNIRVDEEMVGYLQQTGFRISGTNASI